MPTEIVMPRLGWTMEEGTLVEWLKQTGDRIESGDIIFTVESDKAINEIESFDSGTLYIPPDAPLPGDTLPIGTILGYLLGPGEAPPVEAPAKPEVGHETKSGPREPTRSRTRKDRPQGRKIRSAISPRALRLAEELGVDWNTLQGSGRNGRIVERDVRAAVPAQPESVLEGTVRRTIARRLTESHSDTAPVTLSTDADATDFVALRAELDIPLLTYNDLFVKVTALALADHPDLNASWQDGSVRRHEEIHIGIAVDTHAGLFVPVITNAAPETCPISPAKPRTSSRRRGRVTWARNISGAARSRLRTLARTASTRLPPSSICRNAPFSGWAGLSRNRPYSRDASCLATWSP